MLLRVRIGNSSGDDSMLIYRRPSGEYSSSISLLSNASTSVSSLQSMDSANGPNEPTNRIDLVFIFNKNYYSCSISEDDPRHERAIRTHGSWQNYRAKILSSLAMDSSGGDPQEASGLWAFEFDASNRNTFTIKDKGGVGNLVVNLLRCELLLIESPAEIAAIAAEISNRSYELQCDLKSCLREADAAKAEQNKRIDSLLATITALRNEKDQFQDQIFRKMCILLNSKKRESSNSSASAGVDRRPLKETKAAVVPKAAKPAQQRSEVRSGSKSSIVAGSGTNVASASKSAQPLAAASTRVNSNNMNTNNDDTNDDTNDETNDDTNDSSDDSNESGAERSRGLYQRAVVRDARLAATAGTRDEAPYRAESEGNGAVGNGVGGINSGVNVSIVGGFNISSGSSSSSLSNSNSASSANNINMSSTSSVGSVNSFPHSSSINIASSSGSTTGSYSSISNSSSTGNYSSNIYNISSNEMAIDSSQTNSYAMNNIINNSSSFSSSTSSITNNNINNNNSNSNNSNNNSNKRKGVSKFLNDSDSD